MTIDVVWGDARYVCVPAPEPEPTPDPALRVIAYSQNDPRWKHQVYAGGTTFGTAGCLVVSVAMIASLVYADKFTPVDVARHLRSVGAFNGAMLSHPARIPAAFDRLEWGGVAHWRVKPADISALSRELATFGATICEVKWTPNGPSPEQSNQHFVVVEGLDGDDAAIVDPWDGERKLLSESRYRLEGWDVARTLYGMRMVRARR